MDIGLYSGVIDAKSTSDAKDRSNPWMTNEILVFIYERDYTHRMAWPH